MSTVIAKSIKIKLVVFLCSFLSGFSVFSTFAFSTAGGIIWEQSTDPESQLWINQPGSFQNQSDPSIFSDAFINSKPNVNAPVMYAPGGGDPIGGVPIGGVPVGNGTWILISCVFIYLLSKFKRSNLFKRIKNSPSKTKYIEV